MFMVQLKKEHFFFAARALQRVITHGEQKAYAPCIEAEDDSVFGFVDSFAKVPINFPVPGIKAIVARHFEIFFRDMLDEQLNKINGGKSLFNERIVFMPVIVEGNIIAVIGINSGKCNDRTPKVTADIFDNGFRVTETGFCINIKAIFVLMVYLGLGLFERRANAFFQFIQ